MDPKATSAPPISVIVPVYGEAPVIDETVRMVRETAGNRPVEIVVADGGPGHATLKALGEPDVVGVRCPPGRGVQMNAGAAVASGDILLFLHADTRLPMGWPEMVTAALERALAGAFSLVIDSPRPSLAVVARFANLRTRLERVPYGDQAPFFDAAFFRELGGFAAIPIMEDVELFRRIRRRGGRIVLLRERVLTSARRWERDGVLRRTLGNWRLRLRYALGVPPERLAGAYRPQGEDAARDCLLFFVKYPEPGRVKTRLAEAGTPELAAEFYAALAADKLAELAHGLDAPVLVCFAPGERAAEVRAWLGPGHRYLAQRGANLGERMANAFRDAFAMGFERAVLTGSDIPGLTPVIVRQGLDVLAPDRSTFGPAEDGGYYLAGFHRDTFVPAAFDEENWSTPAVYDRAVARLKTKGLAVTSLTRLADVDTVADLRGLLESGGGELSGRALDLARRLAGEAAED